MLMVDFDHRTLHARAEHVILRQYDDIMTSLPSRTFRPLLYHVPEKPEHHVTGHLEFITQQVSHWC
jgi:hypothetical protein